MTTPAVTIGADREVAEAARDDDGAPHQAAPGLWTPGGALVGIVTRADLVKAFARSDEEIACEIREDVVRHALWIDDTKLELGVARGEATLSGRLDRRSDAELDSPGGTRARGGRRAGRCSPGTGTTGRRW